MAASKNPAIAVWRGIVGARQELELAHRNLILLPAPVRENLEPRRQQIVKLIEEMGVLAGELWGVAQTAVESPLEGRADRIDREPREERVREGRPPRPPLVERVQQLGRSASGK